MRKRQMVANSILDWVESNVYAANIALVRLLGGSAGNNLRNMPLVIAILVQNACAELVKSR